MWFTFVSGIIFLLDNAALQMRQTHLGFAPWLTIIPLFQVTAFVLISGLSGLQEPWCRFLTKDGHLTQVCQSESFPGKVG